MNCDEVREQLAEHLLGSLPEEDDAAVRRHLRGCGACRKELASLEEGLATFARAAHQADPPAELRERVLATLAADHEDGGASPLVRRFTGRVLAWAAAFVVLAGSLAWGALATIHASNLSVQAGRYHSFLEALGGRDVRVAVLHATSSRAIEGNAIVYDSDVGQSWVLVMVRAPGMTGQARVLLSSPTRHIELHPMRFSADGDASTWLVTSADIGAFDRCTVMTAGGRAIASGRVGAG